MHLQVPASLLLWIFVLGVLEQLWKGVGVSEGSHLACTWKPNQTVLLAN